MRAFPLSSSFSRVLGAALLAALAACDADAPTAAEVPSFDGEAALALIETQVAFGPRVPGTDAHGAMLIWLENELKARGASVSRRPFTGVSALTGESMAGTNLIAVETHNRSADSSDIGFDLRMDLVIPEVLADLVPIPEPSTLMLLGGGTLGLLACGRRRRWRGL